MSGYGWIQRLRDLPLVVKLISVIVFFNALPLGIASWISYDSFSSSTERNIGKYQEDVVREKTTNLDTYMNEYALLTTLPYQYEEILSFIGSNRPSGKALSLDEHVMFESFVSRMIVNGRVDVAGFGLYGLRGASYVLRPHSFAAITIEDWESESWYARSDFSGKAVFAGPHEIRSTAGDIYEVISVIRKLKSLEDGSELGFIVIDVEFSEFRSRIDELATMEYESVAIADESGMLIYRRGELPLSVKDIAEYRGSGTKRVEWNGESQLLTYYTSSVTGWTTFQTVPMSELLRESNRVRDRVVWIGIVCLVLAAIVSAWLSFRITHPISRLRNLMKRVERGDLDVAAPVRSRDEVGQLSRTFNIMVSRLSELGYRLYESEIREKNAQIAALQSQINPHFLYNTLGAIGMYAEIQNNQEVVHMTNNLSKLLRYSISSDKNEVTLEQELDHVRGYMAIQQVRYEERLSYAIEAPDSLLPTRVLRLILQPIVENAIIHGFEKGGGSGTIRIRVSKTGSLLQIEIEDDGIGMTQSRLDRIRSRLTEEHVSEGLGGHGLANVHRRIALRYGNQYGLTIKSQLSEGTTVIVHMPLIQTESVQ